MSNVSDAGSRSPGEDWEQLSTAARQTAVDKACSVLWAVARRDMSGVGVTQLAKKVGLPKSTTFRLLKTLVRNRALEQYGEHYRLGELFTDGLPTGPHIELVQTALTPLLAKLFELTRCTVQLAVLDDAEVVFLNKLHGIHRVPSPSRIGGRAPAHCTSLGKAMLAYDPASVDTVCARGLDPWTSRTITEPEKLWHELIGVRRSRIAVDDQEYLQLVGSVAAPVLVEGRAVAALAVTGPRDEVIGAGYERSLLHVCARGAQAIERVRESSRSAPEW